MSALIDAACPKCHAHHSKVVLRGRDRLHLKPGEFTTSECVECGLWFQNPRLAAEALYDYYPNDYRPFSSPPLADEPLDMSPSRRRYLAHHLGYSHLDVAADHQLSSSSLFDGWRKWTFGTTLVPRWVEGGRVLEIGCASGKRLVELRKLGWVDLNGIEMMPEAATTARSLGFKVTTGPVEETIETFPDASFDVVVTSMVIEHLLEPFETMRRIAAKLKPGGQLLFSTVCRDSLDARAYGTYWRNLDLPRHMVFFRKKDIEDLVAADFENLEMFWQAAPLDFVGSAKYRADEKPRLLDKLLIKLGERRLYRFALLSAFLHQTSRVSVRCTKRV